MSLQVLAQAAGTHVGLHMPTQVHTVEGCQAWDRQQAGRQEAPDTQAKVTLGATSSELCSDS